MGTIVTTTPAVATTEQTIAAGLETMSTIDNGTEGPTIEQLNAEIARLIAMKSDQKTLTPEDVPAPITVDPGQEVTGNTTVNESPKVQEETSQPFQDDTKKTSRPEEDTQGGVEVATAGIDQAKKEMIETLFKETISDPRFWEKESRLINLKAALVIPVFDDRDMQMFFNSAMDDLGVAAAKESAKTGKPAILPTEAEGIAETYRRKAKKEKELAEKVARKLARENKKLS